MDSKSEGSMTFAGMFFLCNLNALVCFENCDCHIFLWLVSYIVRALAIMKELFLRNTKTVSRSSSDTLMLSIVCYVTCADEIDSYTAHLLLQLGR